MTLPGDLAQWERGTLLDTLRRKVADIETLQAQLARNRAQLAELIGQIEAKPQDMSCEANARRVLSGMRLWTRTARPLPRPLPVPGPAVERPAASSRQRSSAATCSAVALADCGFWPVTRRPSTTTFGTNGSHALS